MTYEYRNTEVFEMLIRDSVKNKIFDALNFDVFRFEDFTTSITENKSDFIDECILIISHDKYYFQITFNYLKCKMHFSPGNIYIDDSCEVKIDLFMREYENYIHEWLYRVKDDMLNPIEKRFIDDEINKFKEEIDSKIAEIEDGYFTKEEGEELRKRLEQSEKVFLERDTQEDLQSEISKMKKEIEFLKSTVNTLTKKKWIRNAFVKMVNWGQKEENRKLIESGFEAVKAISQIDIPKL